MNSQQVNNINIRFIPLHGSTFHFLPERNDGSGSNFLKNNATIISTFRVRADECDRLWVMDTGLADILGDAVQYAPPSLVLFDLYTDKLIRRHFFNSTLLKEDSFFANVVSSIYYRVRDLQSEELSLFYNCTILTVDCRYRAWRLR